MMIAEQHSTMTQWLPEGFISRPAQLDDVEAVVALVNACSLELIGKPECEANEYRNDWQSPTLNMESDLRVVHAPDGEFAGYAGVWDPQPHVRLYSWGYVHPEYRGRGIGTHLVH
ncbi:MAG: GNAT family N-acetyltransferase, partial [Anaerolineae bacterium]|nr:GNAT family N-acetyltransferase [Anaerolineae bacterium]